MGYNTFYPSCLVGAPDSIHKHDDGTTGVVTLKNMNGNINSEKSLLSGGSVRLDGELKLPRDFVEQLTLRDRLYFILLGGPIGGLPSTSEFVSFMRRSLHAAESESIATILNETDAQRCPHDEMSCVIHCGVYYRNDMWHHYSGDQRRAIIETAAQLLACGRVSR